MPHSFEPYLKFCSCCELLWISHLIKEVCSNRLIVDLLWIFHLSKEVCSNGQIVSSFCSSNQMECSIS